MNGGGLVLRLRPHEKFLVNGVVIENGDRRARLRVCTQDAHILRLRDALHPEEATTPAKRLYYAAQLAVAGEADAEQAKTELVRGIEALQQAFGEHICREDLDAALAHAREGKFYHVMRRLARVMPHENALLSLAAPAKAPLEKAG
ncbi:flagellar biosynthesis repressor FlbT [Amphiplicatus metriothermophilus]|uniref:Flagellar protein FlbT n=1 Tax=Amphiplicatus metriothermophilus TaxID=1519374 RepID=A0A239PL41_9PROT|nr:flagellar biosynthesis repressor FlbT [Amphiplicatus metriothermophilus]MBB5517327.1 flagellar protein FlbT [Amphiplicatus metriothermophilus]SNT68337.1 flagellar protein FlbT [Amphiplicatus metriothermophilus]